MPTSEALFTDIAERIEQELSQAEESIYIAVAWFTSKRLFSVLQEKAEQGCKVQLMLSGDSINHSSGIRYTQLNSGGSRVYEVGDGESDLMHHKFCVVDHSTVITGSYNWTNKAESYNYENIVLTKGNSLLAEQFISEFHRLRRRYFPDREGKASSQELPLMKILKRLEIIQNYIILEEVESIDIEVSKLQPYTFHESIATIVALVEQKTFSKAAVAIADFVKNNQQIMVFGEAESIGLKLEIHLLENQLNAYDNERIEIEKQCSAFTHRHSLELGKLILRLLKLRKKQAKPNTPEYEEAQKDEDTYKQQVKTEKAKKIFELSEQEQQELKKAFRKASMLCYPDKVSDEYKQAAQDTFIVLKAAYDSNDLEKVKAILTNLEQGNYFTTQSQTITRIEQLKQAIEILRIKIADTLQAINTLKQSKVYQEIADLTDWDKYFAEKKSQLQKEIDSFE